MDLKNKTSEDLTKGVKEQLSHLQAMRFQLASGQRKDVREIREVKKMIAQMKTAQGALNKSTT